MALEEEQTRNPITRGMIRDNFIDDVTNAQVRDFYKQLKVNITQVKLEDYLVINYDKSEKNYLLKETFGDKEAPRVCIRKSKGPQGYIYDLLIKKSFYSKISS
jgi:hypothetical protein